MAKAGSQKLKLLYLAKILLEETDDAHGLSMSELTERLEKRGISAERQTLYSDFKALRDFGLDVIGDKMDGHYRYHIAGRDFELVELKLLVDSVQAAKFITEKKSRQLIKKLEGLTSVYEGKQLQRQVLIAGRVKSMNESIYYSVDKLHTAINEDRQIRFQYFQWDVNKTQRLRHEGAWYHVSPWALIWDDEYYYLVGYDHLSGILKHYRVDKMKNIKLHEKKREGARLLTGKDLAGYSRRLFGMFGGKEVAVTLEAENRFAGILIDRFGKEIPLYRVDEEHFHAKVSVVPSEHFFGWILSLGEGIRIVEPQSVLSSLREMLERARRTYR